MAGSSYRKNAMIHPKPWRVEYLQRFPKWHKQSMPYIVDACDNIVCEMPMTEGINHPGLYDEVAVQTAKEIVQSVNSIYGELARL